MPLTAMTRAPLPAPAEERRWHIIDAEGLVVGRLAAKIATILRGKDKPQWSPHVDWGDALVVVNADKLHFTGRKREGKKYWRHTGWPGGLRWATPEMMFAGPRPERVLKLAVGRMMPRNRLSRSQFKNLRVYAGVEHPHGGRQPVPLDVGAMNPRNAAR